LVPHIEFHQGIPPELNADAFMSTDVHNLLVLDDCMEYLKKNQAVQALFTEGSHHRSCTVLLLVQNLFANDLRTTSLNAVYVVAFKNPRDQSQIGYLGRQVATGQSRAFQLAYQKAT